MSYRTAAVENPNIAHRRPFLVRKLPFWITRFENNVKEILISLNVSMFS